MRGGREKERGKKKKRVASLLRVVGFIGFERAIAITQGARRKERISSFFA